MLTAALLLAMAAGGHSPLDGRLPAHGQMQAAFAESRACDGATSCQPVTTVTRDEHCHRIQVPRGGDRLPAVAGARCWFRYGEYIASARVARPSRWTGDHADFFLVGTPCGGEGQEADLMCYSWMTPREEN